jgi:hypothetical protein
MTEKQKPYRGLQKALGSAPDGIFRPSYQKANSPEKNPLAWVKPEHLFAMEAGRGLVSFLSWMAMKAMEKTPGKQAPPLTDEEAKKRLDDLKERIDKGDIFDEW